VYKDIIFNKLETIKTKQMKATIKPTSQKKSKYDNVYFDITIKGHLFENIERSEIRHLIQILDNGIGV
jgi:hypothetical protein